MRTVEDAGPYNAREDTLSLFRAYCEKHALISIIVRTRQSSGLSLFQFFHNFTYYNHYNTNRQRKQSLCRFFVSAISPLRMQRENKVLLVFKVIYYLTGVAAYHTEAYKVRNIFPFSREAARGFLPPRSFPSKERLYYRRAV